MSLLLQNVSKSYGAVKALKGLSVKLKKGEVVGLLGPNGAGKSSLMKILTGYYKEWEGEISYDGLDLKIDLQNIQKQIGYLPENNPLPEDLRVIEYLNFRSRLKGLRGSRLKERTKIVLEICDLERKVSERKIGNLSKGFKQRVGIADALLAEPRLVILDEPTIGLDPHQSAITRKMMERLKGEITFLISSHILSEVEACCDRMIILSHGQIVAEGTLHDLQKTFVDKTIFEIVTKGNKIEVQRKIREIDITCELILDDLVDVTGKRRFSFSTLNGEKSAEKIIRHLFNAKELNVSEFHISRPDLETIFLRATKKNWEEKTLIE